jgi:hypothetical protein
VLDAVDFTIAVRRGDEWRIGRRRKEMTMGRIVVHEFITLDGVIDNPVWTMEYGFDPKMGGAIGRIMQPSKALLLGRNTYELFAPTWSTRTAAEDPGAPFMNESPKYVVSSTLQCWAPLSLVMVAPLLLATDVANARTLKRSKGRGPLRSVVVSGRAPERRGMR